MQKFMLILIVIAIYLLLDFYAFQLVKYAAEAYSNFWANAVKIGFWVSSFLLILGLVLLPPVVL